MGWNFFRHMGDSISKSGEPKAKLPKPKKIPIQIGQYLVVQEKEDPDFVWKLMCVLRPYAEHKERFDFRVFRSSSAQIAQVGVTSYDSLDAYPKLIIYHGWYDKFSNLIEIIKGGGLLAA